MPGADLSIDLADLGERGVRSPRHLGAVFSHNQEGLFPFMVAPVRPGETFLGASIQGTTWLNSVINAVQAPMMWAEVGLWYVPLGAMGEWMTQLITNTGDDIEDYTGTTTLAQPGGLGIADSANEPGLQMINRPWAGEVGNGSDTGAIYLPVASRGTYKVASDWYGLNNTVHVNADNRYDNPPQVDDYVMNAARVRADLQGFADGNPSTTTSLASLMETMHLLSRTEITYAEYLAAHGVDPRRAASMTAPLLIEHGYVAPQPDPIFAYANARDAVVTETSENDYASTMGGARFGPNVQNDTDAGFVYDQRPLAAHYKHWKTFRTKPMPIPEPGVIIGTVVAWQEEFGADAAGAAQFDATRLVNGSLWGDRSFGGIDETDFIAVLDTFNRGAGQIDQSIYNMLNLYVNGDIFGFGTEVTGNPFALRALTGRGLTGDYETDFTTKISTQLHILSDLVG